MYGDRGLSYRIGTYDEGDPPLVKSTDSNLMSYFR